MEEHATKEATTREEDNQMERIENESYKAQVSSEVERKATL